MTELHPRTTAADPTDSRFVTLRLGGRTAAVRTPADRAVMPDGGRADADAAGEVVVAQLGAALRSDAVVVARRPSGYEVRRVGRITDDTIELLPLDRMAAPVQVPRDGRAVVGAVVMRWKPM